MIMIKTEKETYRRFQQCLNIGDDTCMYSMYVQYVCMYVIYVRISSENLSSDMELSSAKDCADIWSGSMGTFSNRGFAPRVGLLVSMYILYIRMYILYIRMYVCVNIDSVYMYVCMYVCIYMYVYICMYI